MSDELGYSGAGFVPAGFSPHGGKIAEVEEIPSFRMYQRQNGKRARNALDTGNLLNSVNDWVLDDFGRPFGDSAVRSKIRLILTTERGTAANPNWGLKKFPEILSSAEIADLNVNVRACLKEMTDNGEIELVSVSVDNQSHGRIGIKIVFIDLSNFPLNPESIDV